MQISDAPVPAHVPVDRVVDFDIYNPSPDATGDEYFDIWKQFQDELPELVWTVRNGGHWIATRGTLIREIFNDYKHFSSKILFVPRVEIRLLPTTLDPPANCPFRALVNKALAPAGIRLLEQSIRASTIELIEAVRERGYCHFIEDFANHLPIGVFFKMAKLPIEDQPKLSRWMEHVLRPDGSMGADEAMGHFAAYLKPYIEERRKTPGDDILSHLVTGQIDGQDVTEEDATQLCSTIVLGGLDTVITLMSFTAWHLAKNAKDRAYLSKNIDKIPAAIEEFCRRFPIGLNVRLITEDFEVGGVSVKEGDLISMPQILYSLDETIYPNPLDVDFGRSTVGYCTFGHGAHRCPGEYLAKLEMRVFLEEWLSRIPDFEIEPGARPVVTTGATTGIFNLPLRWDPAPDEARAAA